MSASLPFQITPEAENHIRVCLRPPPGMEPTLFMAHGFEDYDEEGRLKAKFEGDYFIVGFEDPVVMAQWPKFVISDSTVWVDVGTLNYLRGKTLTLRNLEIPTIDSKILVTV